MALLPEHLSSCWRARARLFAIGMIHLCLFTLAGCGAFWLRFEFKIPPNQYAHLSFALAIWLTVKSVVFHLYTVNRGTWRFVSLVDALILFYANLTGSLTAALALRFVAPPGFPRSIYVIDFLLCFLLTTGVRAVVRLLT